MLEQMGEDSVEQSFGNWEISQNNLRFFQSVLHYIRRVYKTIMYNKELKKNKNKFSKTNSSN